MLKLKNIISCQNTNVIKKLVQYLKESFNIFILIFELLLTLFFSVIVCYLDNYVYINVLCYFVYIAPHATLVRAFFDCLLALVQSFEYIM